jgi:integrase
MRGKITKRAVDALVPKNGAEVVLWDQEVRGFGIRARVGGAKTYILHYRAGTGRGAPLRKLTIGKHGSPWTPDMARTEAKRLLGVIASGGDPAEHRVAERKSLSVSELCDLYLAEGATHKKPSTLKTDLGRIVHHIKPLLGRVRVDKVTRADIERILIDVKAGKTAAPTPNERERRPGRIATGGGGVAAQCVALMGALFGFAVARGLRSDNPVRGVKKPAVRKMERFLSEDEIARLAVALDAESNHSGSPYPAAAIKLLLLTGGRRGEILGLQWKDVDFERQCLRLPDSKTGAKIIYLSAPALEVLAGLPRMTTNPYVVPGKSEGKPLVGIDKFWFRVRTAAGLRGVRLHDLRHSFASMAVAGGLSLPIIGALLGHKHPTTTGRYAHLSADPLRAANDVVGMRIAAAMNHTPDVEECSAKKILPMPPRRAS